jgi:hypothetical protein
MPDILTAIADIVHHRAFMLPSAPPAHTAANSSGTPFEMYFKDRLVGLVPGNDPVRVETYRRYLIYQGGANNPPDAMFRGGDEGDAFEFKKFESGPFGDMPLNSSWPKDRLTTSSYGLASACRSCEEWTERDFFYVCGGVPSKTSCLAWIWICDARLMAARNDTYRSLHAAIQSGIASISDVEFAPTVELGKVRNCDRTGRTALRIRGMWSLKKPGEMFRDIQGVKHTDAQNLHALIREEKWKRFPQPSIDRIEELRTTPGFTQTTVKVPDPNTPGAMIPAVLIRYEKVGA